MSAIDVARLAEVAPREEWVTLEYGNRPITVYRARLLGRKPEERAAAVRRRLDELVDQGVVGPVSPQRVENAAVLMLDGRDAVPILAADLDTLAGETLEAAAGAAAGRLRTAVAEVHAAHSPRLLLHAGLRALAATALALVLAYLIWWLREHVARRAPRWLQARLARPLAEHIPGAIWRRTEARLAATLRFLVRLLVLATELSIAYGWLTYVMRQFPYTRPWGEALRSFVIATVLSLARGMLTAVPGLFTVVLIVFLTRLASRLLSGVFSAVEQGHLSLPGVYPETVQPTRRLATALLWLFAVVVAYPYLPGSGTDAFKGVSVFVGLMISLGSSGLVNQVMSSFTITYGRALRVGDYVRIGEIEGTIAHAGILATKILTVRNEEVTLPNAVVAASTIVNYSRHAGEGVFTRTSLTIGYDTPWRQVEALLLEAAARTPGVRQDPAPRVLQSGLQDFYVEYALLVVPERPEERIPVLARLHSNIQDAFNEHAVQIMSPHYRADPEAPKVVPRAGWYAPPAKPRDGA